MDNRISASAAVAVVAASLAAGQAAAGEKPNTASVRASARLAVAQTRTLVFSSSGRVTFVGVREGEKVARGQILARVDDSEARTALQAALSTLAQARASLSELVAGAGAEERARTELAVRQAELAAEQAGVRFRDARSSHREELEKLAGAHLHAADALRTARASLARARAALALERPEVAAARGEVATLQVLQQEHQQRQLEVQAQQTEANVQLQTPLEDAAATGAGREAACAPGAGTSACAAAKEAESKARARVYEARLLVDLLRAEAAALERTLNRDGFALAQAQTRVQDAATRAGQAESEIASAKGEARSAAGNVEAAAADLLSRRRSGRAAVREAANALATARLSLGGAMNDQRERLSEPPSHELAAARAAIAAARAGARSARGTIAQRVLRAPFAGVVSKLDLRAGQPAGTTGGVTLVAVDSLIADVPVGPLDVGRVRVGQSVTATVAGLVITGRVASVGLLPMSGAGDPTYPVRVVFGGLPPGTRPGMTARVTIEISEAA